MDLLINRIYGTSSNNQLNVSVSKNLIAYVASGGVVVCKINKQTAQLTDQRFLCANNTNLSSSFSLSSSASALSSSSTIMPSSYSSYLMGNGETERDQYGTPKPLQTVHIDDQNQPQIGDLSLNSPASKQQQQAQRMKTITCVAISPDEKLLAIGESGTQPRILIFSLAPDSNDFPILSIVEHNFGVFALKFSSDSKYLLSIGDPHDGFIYLWKISGLHMEIVAANRCTSQINGVYWVNDVIITFGVRHIKVWKYEQFERKSMLQGKNVILGECINSNFVYCTGGFGTDNNFLFLDSLGEVFGYNVNSNTLKLRYQAEDDMGGEKLGALLIDNDKLWLGGDTFRQISVPNLGADLSKQFDPTIESPAKNKFNPKITCVEKFNDNKLLYVTSNEEILLYDIVTHDSAPLIDSLSKSVSGIKVASNGQIVNWTRDGVLKLIEKDSLNLVDFIRIEIPEIPNKVIENHITSLEITEADEIVVGDSYGNLSIFDKTGKSVFCIAAHEFSINDVCYFRVDGVEFIVSTGRDRMIQVYAKSEKVGIEDVTSEWSIYQTLDEHKGNLLKLLQKDGKIYVSSADRTVSVHKFKILEAEVQIVKEKTISLKATPSTMTFTNEELIVFTMDKNVTVYNFTSLESTRAFKLYDPDSESLLVDAAAFTAQGHLFCSCTDKSVRVFSYTTGKQLSANWGHCEPIKFLLLFSSDRIITLSNSGCLFSWFLKPKSEIERSPSVSTSLQKYTDLSTPQKVTRKIKKRQSMKTVVNSTSTPTRSPMVSRTPTTNNRLQSTAKLTPRLSSSSRSNLSPSPNGTASPMAHKANRLSVGGASAVRSTPTKSHNSSSNSKYNGSSHGHSISHNLCHGSNSRNSVRGGANNENKQRVDDIVNCLKSFKENLDSYTHEEVALVKAEIKGVFHYENELLKNYSDILLSSIKSQGSQLGPGQNSIPNGLPNGHAHANQNSSISSISTIGHSSLNGHIGQNSEIVLNGDDIKSHLKDDDVE